MNYRGAQSEAENLEDLPETHHPSPPETGAASFDDLLGEIEGTTREDRSDSIDAPQAFHADASASRSQSVSNSSAEDDIDNNDDLADFDPQAIRSPGISPPTAPGSVTGLQGMGNTGYTPQVQKPSMLSRFRAAFSSAISSVARAVGKVIDAVASRPVQSGPERPRRFVRSHGNHRRTARRDSRSGARANRRRARRPFALALAFARPVGTVAPLEVRAGGG